MTPVSARTGTTEAFLDALDALACRPLPSDVRERALDVAVVVAACQRSGAASTSARGAAGAAMEEGAGDDATILPGGGRSSVPVAALVNTDNALHGLPTDLDVRMRAAPCAVVVASALATAEGAGRSIDDLLCAIALGLEVVTRLAASMGSGQRPSGGPPWPNVGATLGGVVSCAGLLGLTRQEAGHAFGIAAFAAPLASAHRSARATLLEGGTGASGYQAWTACTSAALAAGGWTGDVTVLDGPDDLWEMAGSRGHDPRVLTTGFGDSWALLDEPRAATSPWVGDVIGRDPGVGRLFHDLPGTAHVGGLVGGLVHRDTHRDAR